jgi:hypothetical protein
MIVVAAVVDHEGFERLEEKPRRGTDARRAFALIARDPPQFLENEIDSGNILAAQHTALELTDQQ